MNRPRLAGRRSVVVPSRAKAVVCVLAFLAAFFGLGAIARSTRATTTVAPAVTGAGGSIPFASWYWTMAVSASNPPTFVLGTSKGIYRSVDAGKTWQATGPAGLNATSIADDGTTVLAGGAIGGAPSPVVRRGAGRVVANGKAWLAKSTDAGATWQTLEATGLPPVAIQALAVDAATNAIYALLNNGALYRTADGGQSFTLVSRQLGIIPWALAITSGTRFVGGDMDVGPHVGENAKGWLLTPYTDARGGHMVMEYAVQPADPNRVLMTSIGIKLSTDGGQHWQPSLTSSVMFGPVAWAPQNPSEAYAVGFDSSLWRTDDAGRNWVKAA